MKFEEYIASYEFDELSQKLLKGKKRVRTTLLALSAVVLVFAVVALVSIIVLIASSAARAVLWSILIASVLIMIAARLSVSLLNKNFYKKANREIILGWEMLLKDIDIELYADGSIDLTVKRVGTKNEKGKFTNLSNVTFVAQGVEKTISCERMGEIGGWYLTDFYEYALYAKAKAVCEQGLPLATAKITYLDKDVSAEDEQEFTVLYIEEGQFTQEGKDEYDYLKKMGLDV